MSLRRLSRPTGLLAGLVTAWVISSHQVPVVGALSDSSSSSTSTSCTSFLGNAGDGICDHDLNTEECGYDGGDCCSCTCVDDPSQTSGSSGSPGSLTGPTSAYTGCGSFGFACVDPSAECINDDDIESSTMLNCVANYLGDGFCDTTNNIADCGYDGGDCCVCTCADGPAYQCGVTGYTCIDPAALCVNDDDDDTTVGLFDDSSTSWFYDDSNLPWIDDDAFWEGLFDDDGAYEDDDSPWPASCISDFLNDNDCDFSNNNEACGYDGGDCCSCTCTDTPGASYQCGENGYACIDPDAPCVNDDDVTTLDYSESLTSDDSLPSEPTTDDSSPSSDDSAETDDDEATGVVPSDDSAEADDDERSVDLPSDDSADSGDGSPLPQSAALSLMTSSSGLSTALVAVYGAIQLALAV